MPIKKPVDPKVQAQLDKMRARQQAIAPKTPTNDAKRIAGKAKLASEGREAVQAKPAKPVPATPKMLNKSVIYVDHEGRERHARIVAGDSETVNLVVTVDDPQNPSRHVQNVKRGKGSTPNTWHPES